MEKNKIRVSLQSFNYRILDQATKKVISFVESLESIQKVKGPIFMPTKRRIYCVLRSPHVDKDSREQFEIRRYKRFFDIYSESLEISDAFLNLELPAGVSSSIKTYFQPDFVSKNSES